MHDIRLIVHCWKYSRCLDWQLWSIHQHYADQKDFSIHVHVCTALEDIETRQVISKYPESLVSPYYLPKPKLFNRAVGRNLLAKRPHDGWTWFADSDYAFGPKSLRELATIDPSEHTLCYPHTVLATKTHAIGDQYIAAGPSRGIDLVDFYPKGCGKSIGGLQLTPSRIANEKGYCDWPKAQRPIEGDSFADTRSDRSFRVSLGTSGTPIDLSDVYRLRHSASGLARPVGGRDKWTGN